MDPVLLAGLSFALLAAVAFFWWRGRARDRKRAPRAKSERVRKDDLAIRPLEGHGWEDDEDDDVTVLRVSVNPSGESEPANADTELFFADPGADVDIPTRADASIITSAIAQSDPGRKRRRNEDRYLKLDSHHVYAVADGMGGHAGGHIAAQIAMDTLQAAFEERRFDAITTGEDLPWRADELVKAVQAANLRVWERGKAEPWLSSMGTTLVAARFAPRKDRVYFAHVGDSRCYRLRDGELRQLTRDHTYAELGLIQDGPAGSALSRAVGSSPRLTVDVIIATPRIGDRYLLCTDGLSRMVEEGCIAETLGAGDDIAEGATTLVSMANERGGVDNVTVVVVEVSTPGDAMRLDERRRRAG